MVLSIAISGAAGRMGRALVRAAAVRTDLKITGGLERRGKGAIGMDLGAIAGCDPIGVAITDDAASAAAGADVWIDFTAPGATLSALEALAASPVRAAIIGTTGLTPEQEHAIGAVAQRLAIVRSGNFSLGIHALAGLVRQAAQKLGAGWDIEIIEQHHWRKVDAPSGTALMLGEAAAQGRARTLSEVRLAPRHGVGDERPEGGIGFAVVRGGGIVGNHDVIFAAEREVLTLSHKALDRAVFADGALAAAIWAADQNPGLYSMADVLGLG